MLLFGLNRCAQGAYLWMFVCGPNISPSLFPFASCSTLRSSPSFLSLSSLSPSPVPSLPVSNTHTYSLIHMHTLIPSDEHFHPSPVMGLLPLIISVEHREPPASRGCASPKIRPPPTFIRCIKGILLLPLIYIVFSFSIL